MGKGLQGVPDLVAAVVARGWVDTKAQEVESRVVVAIEGQIQELGILHNPQTQVEPFRDRNTEVASGVARHNAQDVPHTQKAPVVALAVEPQAEALILELGVEVVVVVVVEVVEVEAAVQGEGQSQAQPVAPTARGRLQSQVYAPGHR